MDEQKSDTDQRRDAMLLRALKAPPQPRRKRDRAAKTEKGREPEPAPKTA